MPFSFLKEKQFNDLDSVEATLHHRQIILNKPFLRKLYEEWYRTFVQLTTVQSEGKLLEIGSGGGFLKDIYPEIITSDIKELPDCKMVINAESLPFENGSLNAIFMLNVLHHIPNCENFFKEAERTLMKDGLIFMIEPANTLFSRFIYNKLHQEPFDENTGWEFPANGPLSGANVALPWIVFHRDANEFHQKFPLLKTEKITLHTPFRYLLTGGLSYKSVVPGWGYSTVSFFEKLFSPLHPYTAMFQTILVRKTDERQT
ncbi:MAG: SAM-dependent methyltransferase [Flavobacteriales bacterium]|nr:MAG: SAM-dependent methyltransferase [Flavobacteriales bacterium]